MPHESIAEINAAALDERIAALEDELADLRARRRALEPTYERVTADELNVGDGEVGATP